MFDSVSVLFSDVVTFTEICSRISPMEVVSMLNAMYSIFDNLTERNEVYKVETIGDAYMVVGGAPTKDVNHAERVCNMALDMIEAITDLKDPSTDLHLKIRVGIHSGTVVAGIVGLKMPRYCLFGDSVNTASRMESTSEAMKIHISEYTRDLLPPDFKVLERGIVSVKGKGEMQTFWLKHRENRQPLNRRTSSPGKTLNAIPTEVGKISPRGSTAGMSDGGTGRGVYSPVTFQDVAMRSVANSPCKTPNRESRSNSIAMGTVYLNSPSSASTISDLKQRMRTPSIKKITPILRTAPKPPPATTSNQLTLKPPTNVEWPPQPPPSKATPAWTSPPRPKPQVSIVETDVDDQQASPPSRRMPSTSQSDGNLCVRAKRMILLGDIPPNVCCPGLYLQESPQACCVGHRGHSGHKNKHRNSISCVLL